MTLLAENIELSEPEAKQIINEILDKIIEVPARHEIYKAENLITEGEALEELEQLFVELFETARTVCASELIESLARLTLICLLSDEIKNLKTTDEVNQTSQSTGTHEIIRKILVGLSIIKKAMAQAGAIGKSALQLYNVQVAT